MPSEHSRFSPSAASRWLACPGSLDYEAPESTANEYTAEGTAAHDLAQRCWLTGEDPETYLGLAILQDGFQIIVTQEMIDAVNTYLGVLDRYDDVQTELRIQSDLYPDFGGTLDAVSPSTPAIIDFKYGAGVAVDVEHNAQLSCYAILLTLGVLSEIRSVSLTVVQPRAHHSQGPIRTWVATREYLEDFYDRLTAVFKGHRAGELNAGDHCRWCPHKVECPELYELTLLTAKTEFAPSGMDPAKAAEVMSKGGAVKAYLDAVYQWAHGQLDKGQAIPGYKLVRRYGNRRWAVDENEILRRCRSRKIGKKQIYKTELLSPAQLEKVAGKELVAELTERPDLGTTVVPEVDKRPAVEPMSAASEFERISDE